MKEIAVITGDITHFTQLTASDRHALIDETEQLLTAWAEKPEDAAVFRGDSFQLLVPDPKKALYRSIQLICWFKKNSNLKTKIQLSARVAIGIGEISYQGKSVMDSDGEAFHNSGRSFDNMAVHDLLTIKTPKEAINKQMAMLLIFINPIIMKWSPGQAEVIFLLIDGHTQTKMADLLKISQGAINNRIKTSHWKAVEKGIDYIAELMNP